MVWKWNQSPGREKLFVSKTVRKNTWITTDISIRVPLWYLSGTPLSPPERSFFSLSILKSVFTCTLVWVHLEGYPQKSFTLNSNVLKVDFLKKGGGGTPPHFARNEGTVKSTTWFDVQSCYRISRIATWISFQTLCIFSNGKFIDFPEEFSENILQGSPGRP